MALLDQRSGLLRRFDIAAEQVDAADASLRQPFENVRWGSRAVKTHHHHLSDFLRQGHYRCLILGSSKSRRPSPKRLKPRVKIIMPIPGKIDM